MEMITFDEMTLCRRTSRGRLPSPFPLVTDPQLWQPTRTVRARLDMGWREIDHAWGQSEIEPTSDPLWKQSPPLWRGITSPRVRSSVIGVDVASGASDVFAVLSTAVGGMSEAFRLTALQFATVAPAVRRAVKAFSDAEEKLFREELLKDARRRPNECSPNMDRVIPDRCLTPELRYSAVEFDEDFGRLQERIRRDFILKDALAHAGRTLREIDMVLSAKERGDVWHDWVRALTCVTFWQQDLALCRWRAGFSWWEWCYDVDDWRQMRLWHDFDKYHLATLPARISIKQYVTECLYRMPNLPPFLKPRARYFFPRNHSIWGAFQMGAAMTELKGDAAPARETLAEQGIYDHGYRAKYNYPPDHPNCRSDLTADAVSGVITGSTSIPIDEFSRVMKRAFRNTLGPRLCPEIRSGIKDAFATAIAGEHPFYMEHGR